MARLKLSYGVHNSEIPAFSEGDEAAKRYLARYTDRTHEEYARALAFFFNWLKRMKGITLTPTEFLNTQFKKGKSNRIEERRWAANLAIEFCRDNPDFQDLSGTHMRLHWTVIKGFFDASEVTLCNAKNPLGRKSGRRKYKPKPLSREDAKKILAVLNQRDRCIALIMVQSGLSIGDVLRKFNFMLDYIQARIRAGAERIKIEFDERKGNGFSYFTFISQDAIQELRKWLIQRERWIQKTGLAAEAEKAIFISLTGRTMTVPKFERNFQNQLYRSKLKTGAYGIVSHQLRKVFKTESSPPERGIDSRIVEFMLGHKGGLEAVGNTYDESPQIYERTIEKEYQKLEPYINLYSGVAAEAQGESEAIKNEVQQLRAEVKHMSRYTDALEKMMGGSKEFTPEEEHIVLQRVWNILNKKDPEKPGPEA